MCDVVLDLGAMAMLVLSWLLYRIKVYTYSVLGILHHVAIS